MSKCEICKKETKSKVWECNILEHVYLCKECQKTRFAKCKKCEEYYLKEEIKNKYCLICG